ncbi:hypothetical protein HRbin36_01564 [bacterium HR36]|nr:hypothetical protein HRbin36_01564 [bacterium HR36]
MAIGPIPVMVLVPFPETLRPLVSSSSNVPVLTFNVNCTLLLPASGSTTDKALLLAAEKTSGVPAPVVWALGTLTRGGSFLGKTTMGIVSVSLTVSPANLATTVSVAGPL